MFVGVLFEKAELVLDLAQEMLACLFD